MESLGACSFTRKWRVCGGNWWRRCGPFSMWESLHVWIAGWQQLLQRKSLFYRNGNLFPPGLNQDKSSLNPIQTHLIKSALCVLWTWGRQITSVTCCLLLLGPSQFFFSVYIELWGKIFLKKSGVASYLVLLVRWELEFKLVKEKILHGWNPVATGGSYESNYIGSCSHNPTDDSCSPVFFCFFFARHSVR